MGHGLTQTDGMLSVREVPWHGLGLVVENAPANAREAFTLAGMDWEPEKAPVFVRNADGSYSEVGGYAAILRGDTATPLSVMGDDYGTIPTALIEEVVDEFGRQGATIETNGTLGGGRHGWALLSSGDGLAIPGDDSLTRGFLLLSWSHDGTRKFTVRDTAIRVVCQNTLTAALGGSSASFTVKHTKGAAARVEAYRERVAALADDLAAFGEMAAALSAAPFEREEWLTLAGALFPLHTDEDGKVLDDLRTSRAFEAQDALLALRGGATVAGAMEGNAWGAWNAAVEVYDHLLGVVVNPDARNLRPEATFRRTLGGERDEAKRNALTVVGSIAGVAVA